MWDELKGGHGLFFFVVVVLIVCLFFSFGSCFYQKWLITETESNPRTKKSWSLKYSTVSSRSHWWSLDLI